MSVPVSVTFPIAFNAIRKGGRKEDVFINNAAVDVQLEELSLTETNEVLRTNFDGWDWNVFRADAEGRFYWQRGNAPQPNYKYSAERHDNAAVPRPGNVELKDLYPHFAREFHPKVKSAYNSGNWSGPEFTQEAYKSYDAVTIDNQISERLETLKRYVIIGDHLYIRVEEPILRMRSDGSAFSWPNDPWYNAYPYGCYSFAEIDAVIMIASRMNPKLDRQAFLEKFEVIDANVLTPTLVERRLSLLPYWFVTRLPELLSSVGGLETITFITALSDTDRALLRDIHQAVQKTNSGIIDEQVLDTAERLLNLDDLSHLKFTVLKFVDAHPMLDHLREEWATRPISIDIPFG